MSPSAAVVIICSACACGPTSQQQPCTGDFILKSPGVVQMTGTDITITYDVSANNYRVEREGVSRTAYDMDAAVEAAKEMAQRLAQLGVRP